MLHIKSQKGNFRKQTETMAPDKQQLFIPLVIRKQQQSVTFLEAVMSHHSDVTSSTGTSSTNLSYHRTGTLKKDASWESSQERKYIASTDNLNLARTPTSLKDATIYMIFNCVKANSLDSLQGLKY